MAERASYRRHDGTWFHIDGPKAGRPVGALRRRRLRRQLVLAEQGPANGTDGFGGDDLGGAAGVREPRRPMPPTPAAAAAVELPVD